MGSFINVYGAGGGGRVKGYDIGPFRRNFKKLAKKCNKSNKIRKNYELCSKIMPPPPARACPQEICKKDLSCPSSGL